MSSNQNKNKKMSQRVNMNNIMAKKKQHNRKMKRIEQSGLAFQLSCQITKYNNTSTDKLYFFHSTFNLYFWNF